MHQQTQSPFDPEQFLSSPLQKKAYRLFARPIDRILAVSKLEQQFDRARERTSETNDPFLQSLLVEKKIAPKVDPEDLAKIPKEGPVLIVSNHPYGMLDAAMLCNLFSAYRADTKFLANYLITKVPESRPFVIPVDPFDSEKSAAQNLRPIREAMRWLKGGHLLATFPAGVVAHLKIKNRGVLDPPWSPHVASIARRTGATVVPVFISGRNSALFQALGLVHPMFRTALLARELANKSSQEIDIHIGTPIPPGKLENFESDGDRIDFLRVRSHILPHRSHSITIEDNQSQLPELPDDVPREVSLALQEEVASLPPECCVLRKGDFAVYVTTAQQIPKILPEIGRLREVTFRQVGEGSGSDTDLDRFDDYYLHAFAWNHAEGDIVGAYRLGQTDKILAERGPRGLYTSTLFKFEPEFLNRLNPALELGRSFICSRYQKKHSSLALMWKGILHWVASSNPHYKTFFGPVSISQEYNALSKNLIVQYLRRKLSNPEVSAFVKPRNPFKPKRILGLEKSAISRNIRSTEEVSALVSEIEEDGKGVPILIKHYLKMNATLLSFNVDPDFSNVLDGLLMSDMTTTDPKLLKLYMGEELRDKFLAFHQKE